MIGKAFIKFGDKELNVDITKVDIDFSGNGEAMKVRMDGVQSQHIQMNKAFIDEDFYDRIKNETLVYENRLKPGWIYNQEERDKWKELYLDNGWKYQVDKAAFGGDKTTFHSAIPHHANCKCLVTMRHSTICPYLPTTTSQINTNPCTIEELQKITNILKEDRKKSESETIMSATKYYKVLKETPLWEEGAIIARDSDGDYKAVNNLWNKIEGNTTEYCKYTIVEAKVNSSFFERVYEIKDGDTVKYGTKEQAKAALNASTTVA